jgi:hypothetical protein
MGAPYGLVGGGALQRCQTERKADRVAPADLRRLFPASLPVLVLNHSREQAVV